jgi:hypothetical protein
MRRVRAPKESQICPEQISPLRAREFGDGGGGTLESQPSFAKVSKHTHRAAHALYLFAQEQERARFEAWQLARHSSPLCRRRQPSRN